jgi:hypothetical protein
MELVEHHRADAFQRRIAQDHPAEHPLGDHLDAGLGRDLGLHPHAVAHGLAHRFAQGLGHPFGGGAGGQAPRLQHDDLASGQPAGVEQPQRHDRGLAGPGRRHQHGRCPRLQGGA